MSQLDYRRSLLASGPHVVAGPIDPSVAADPVKSVRRVVPHYCAGTCANRCRAEHVVLTNNMFRATSVRTLLLVSMVYLHRGDKYQLTDADGNYALEPLQFATPDRYQR